MELLKKQRDQIDEAIEALFARIDSLEEIQKSFVQGVRNLC
jgi:prefoldin subunit 5